ncbi:MAG: hypothetical protein WAV76_16445 [Bacteroidota bacterium]
MNSIVDEQSILRRLWRSWSLQTSSKWTPSNPASGQCGVTALVINDFFGGEILKTRLENGKWHFYNRISGSRFDFTASQFSKPVTYNDIPSNRDEAFADTNEMQYRLLSSAFIKTS